MRSCLVIRIYNIILCTIYSTSARGLAHRIKNEYNTCTAFCFPESCSLLLLLLPSTNTNTIARYNIMYIMVCNSYLLLASAAIPRRWKLSLYVRIMTCVIIRYIMCLYDFRSALCSRTHLSIVNYGNFASFEIGVIIIIHTHAMPAAVRPSYIGIL